MASPELSKLFASTTRDNATKPVPRRSRRKLGSIPLNYGYPFAESFPNEELTRALREAFEQEPGRVLQYGSGAVAQSLPLFLAGRAARRGMTVSEDEIAVTNGAAQAIDLVGRVFLDRGDFIMSEAPTFMGALGLFRSFSVTCLGFAMDEEGLIVASVEEELARRREHNEIMPKFFYTIPNYQNPKGVTMSLERRRELLRVASEYGFLVVEDDAYGELVFEGEVQPTLKELDTEDRVIHLGTFSKVIGPGVRLGWVFAEPTIVDQVRRLQPGSTNGLAQTAVARYCSTVEFDERVQWLRDSYRRRRDAMLEALEAFMPDYVQWTRPQGGFFVWLELPRDMDGRQVAAQALEQGVGVLTGGMFFPDGSGNNCLRLSFSCPSRDDIKRGIELLAEVIRGSE